MMATHGFSDRTRDRREVITAAPGLGGLRALSDNLASGGGGGGGGGVIDINSGPTQSFYSHLSPDYWDTKYHTNMWTSSQSIFGQMRAKQSRQVHLS